MSRGGRNAGHKVYFGDATNLAFLEACGLKEAKALAITMDAPSPRRGRSCAMVREHHSDLKIIARARDERHAQKTLCSRASPRPCQKPSRRVCNWLKRVLVETGRGPWASPSPPSTNAATSHANCWGRPDRRAEVAKMRNRMKQNGV